ncbi:MAG: phosphatase PAP2 family protein [Lachnospiraceae bacterium]|nr:phosphatase PAP2 family protein [Lachnospiraceae bacterium]
MDSAILLWIQETLRAPILNPVMIFITHLGDHGAVWLALTVLLLALPRTRKMGIACFLSLLLMGTTCDLILKNVVARIRPYEVIEGLECLVGPQVDYSFPSGHTASSFACAYVILRMATKKAAAVPALVLAALIAFSRLYVGVHYPTDVLAGMVWGVLCGIAGCRIVLSLPENRLRSLSH